jgi:hypothetical protein
MRCLLAILIAVAVGMPASAADVKPGAGRYGIAPSDDGFVRLDTATGAVSHCGRRDGAWSCDVLIEEQSARDKEIAGLKQQLAAMTAELSRLAAQVAGLDARLKAVEAAPPAAPESRVSTEGARPVTRPRGFAQEVMQRFITFVRVMKRDDPHGI